MHYGHVHVFHSIEVIVIYVIVMNDSNPWLYALLLCFC